MISSCFIYRTLQISIANVYSKNVETVNLFPFKLFALFLIMFGVEAESVNTF